MLGPYEYFVDRIDLISYVIKMLNYSLTLHKFYMSKHRHTYPTLLTSAHIHAHVNMY